jgi:hypothetical protein
LNGLNDGLANALEAQDFENLQGMVNKALMLENRRGMMECKRKLMHQHQPSSSSRPRVTTSSAGPVFHPAQPQFQPRLQAAEQIVSTPHHHMIQPPNNSRLLLLGIRVFREPKLPKTRNKLIIGAITVVNGDITLIDAPFRTLMSISLL